MKRLMFRFEILAVKIMLRTEMFQKQKNKICQTEMSVLWDEQEIEISVNILSF